MHRPRIVADVARLLQHPASLWSVLYAAYAWCFARTLGYGLVWDDAVLPRFARGGAPLSQLLLAPQQAILDPVENARSGAVMRADSYRPLQSLSHVLDLRGLDATPAVMHLHNLLLGALNIALAHRVACRLGATRGAALFAAAVFALHPLVVEPIAYVSARGDLLATAFALLALAFALPDRDGPAKLPIGAICASAACYFLSLLAKEAYALLPLIVAVAAVLDRDLRARIPVLAAHAAAAAAYVALRANAMGRDAAQLGPGPFGALLHAPAVVLQYVRSFVLPLDASIARQEEPGLAAPGIALMLAGAVIAVLLARRMHAQPSSDRAARLGILALVWIVVLLAPSWVVVADTHVLSDRYFYLPLLGAALLCAAVYARLQLQLRGALARRLVLAGALGWAALALLATLRHVPDFRDNRALYTQAVLAAPRSAFAHYQLGHLEATERHWPRAAALFARAIELDPRDVRAHDNLGVALLELHQPEQAAAVLRAAIALAPGLNYRAFYNLGLAQRQLGDDAGACASFQAAHRINARYALAASMLAACESRAQAAP